MYDDEPALTNLSFLIYQALKVDSMLLALNMGASYSCIGDTASETIVRKFGRRYIPIIDQKREFELRETLLKTRGLIEHMLQTRRSTLDIPVILDVKDIEIPTFAGPDFLDGETLNVDNATNHVFSCLPTNKVLL